MIQSPYNIIHVFHIMCFKSKTHKIGYLNNQIDQAQGNIIAYIGLVENNTYYLNTLKLDRYHKYECCCSQQCLANNEN